MGDFSKMLSQIKNFNTTFEDSVQLNLFMGTLKRFNSGGDLPKRSIEKMEKYFKYRWEHNLHTSQEDKKLFNTLPRPLQRRIFVEYLFARFLDSYKYTFIKMKVMESQPVEFITPLSQGLRPKTAVMPGFEELGDSKQDLIVTILESLEPKKVKRKVF